MRLQRILNQIEKQPGFVYGAARFVEMRHRPALEVVLRPRRNRRGRCSGCQKPAPGYDTLARRRFEFVPLWGLLVFFVYALRRVQCPRGVRVEVVPWVAGKHQLTTTYAWFLARWAKRLSSTAVAESFHITWTHVYRSVEMAVAWGRAHQDLTGVAAIGFDEIQWHRGHRYLTLVYQIDAHCRRLLWIGEGRTVKTALRFFRWFGRARTQALRFVCSDMWKPYLKVIAKKAPAALHILDRFHIMTHLSKAIDQVRAEEARALKARGEEPLLSQTRWVLLKRPENLTDVQIPKLAVLLRYNLRTVRAYLLKEEFQLFWTYLYPAWAGRFLDRWCTHARRSRLEPMKKVAAMLTGHRLLLLNWFRAGGRISGGAVEGFNNHAKLTMRRSFGFRTFTVIELGLFHTLGKLPEPIRTHSFF